VATGRVLALATVPRIYDRIASDPRDMRVVGLPFGIRDGASSVGNFSALAQFYQTHHEKRLIGGYLSRVSRRRVAALRRFPVLDALLVLSEGRPLDESTRQRALESAGRFVERRSIGHVVIDTAHASSQLIEFAIEAFDLARRSTRKVRSGCTSPVDVPHLKMRPTKSPYAGRVFRLGMGRS
jgi:hypothetical protein